MSKKQTTGAPSAAMLAKAAEQAEALSTTTAVKEPPDPALTPVPEPAPEEGPVPPDADESEIESTRSSIALAADKVRDRVEELTIDNCTHLANSKGRIFIATEVLRRLARRQNLRPVPAPK